MKNLINQLSSRFLYLEDKITQWNRKKNVKTFNFGLVLVLSFIGILLLNLAHPIFGDDWGYSLIGGNTNQRITNLGQILHAQYEHYFYWGGRSVVHVIAQFLLMIDEQWADILNSLAYVALTLVIYKIAVPQKKLYPSILILINLSICFFQHTFGSTMLWITGSANYLWGTLIILLFLLPYITEFRREESISPKQNILKAVAFLFGGIIAGWTNENMSVALIFMLVLFLFIYKQQNKTVPKWAIVGLVGACIGCVVMLAAPGNYVRYDTSLEMTGQNSPFVIVFFHRFIAAISGLYYYSFGLIFIFALLLILSTTLSEESKKKANRTLAIVLFLGAIVATLAMSASPIFPERASYGINTLIIAGITLLLASLDFRQKTVGRLVACLAIFGLMLYSADYYRGYKDLAGARTILDQRLVEVEQHKEKNELDFTLQGVGIIPQTRYFHYYELRTNPDDWHNEMFAKYWQLDSVRFVAK